MAAIVASVRPVGAQEPPGRIGPFVVDLHGVVPKVVGMKLPEARKQLERLMVKITVRGTGSKIVRQRPKAGVAAGQGLPVTLWVKRG
jgi:hypothetical protein